MFHISDVVRASGRVDTDTWWQWEELQAPLRLTLSAWTRSGCLTVVLHPGSEVSVISDQIRVHFVLLLSSQ